MPSGSEYVVLSGLDWDTEYNVIVVAENQKGKSPPATMSFRTTSKPEAVPGTRTKPDRDTQKSEEPNSKR